MFSAQMPQLSPLTMMATLSAGGLINSPLLSASSPLLSASSAVAAVPPSGKQTEVSRMIPKDDAKRLIGPKGANIKWVREKAGCKVHMDNDDLPGGPELPPGTVCHALHVTGPESQVEVALKLINELIAADPADTARGKSTVMSTSGLGQQMLPVTDLASMLSYEEQQQLLQIRQSPMQTMLSTPATLKRKGE